MTVDQEEQNKGTDRKKFLRRLETAALIVLLGFALYWWWPKLGQFWNYLTSLPVDAPLWVWIGRIVKSIGFVAAGVWAYFNFVKSREYYPRMELNCSGFMMSGDSARRLFAPRITLKHIGKSKIVINQEGSAYKVLFSDGSGSGTKRIIWKTDGKNYSLFLKHAWIEPGESIFQESEVFVIPSWAVAAKVEARIIGRVRPIIREKIIVWNNSAVVDCSAKEKDGSATEKGSFNAIQFFC